MRIPSWISAAVVATLVSACTVTPPPRLYVLSSLSSPGTEPRQLALAALPEPSSGSPTAPRRSPMTTIGIVPVTVAQYLDRPEIIVRRSHNELQILESDRWAEPVGATATRALVENLSILLSQSRVSTTPLRGSQRATYELSLDLTAFEVDETGAAVLAGDWTLVDPATGAARAGGRMNKSIAVGREASGDAIAAAMSRNLVEASQDIAREIAAIGPAERPRGRGGR
jgi:uncharacterized lipoprotein YmbA